MHWNFQKRENYDKAVLKDFRFSRVTISYMAISNSVIFYIVITYTLNLLLVGEMLCICTVLL